jgi:superfamily I DNA/RNA helicase
MIWTTTAPTTRQLLGQGFHLLHFASFKKQVLSARQAGANRSSLKNPAGKILKVFQRQAKIAILAVHCPHIEDLQILYGYVVEPAFRCGCVLLIAADEDLADISTRTRQTSLEDPAWRYPWTLERLQYLSGRGTSTREIPAPENDNRWRRIWTQVSRRLGSPRENRQERRLDREQNAAVNAGDGVVQVIAPAGSGKTTVLIERVKELQRRGSPASRILCMSFNRDAKTEIGQRLDCAGVTGVVVRSFHGMGLAILKEEGCLRSAIDGLDDQVLEQLIQQSTNLEAAVSDTGEPVCKTPEMTVPQARNAISQFKLALMISSPEALRQTREASLENRLAARVYALYQDELVRRKVLDFDDLVANTVALLQNDTQARSRWQGRFDRVLVDEYQDIEPAQALLVGILAAPQDSLFCVGDEDQCIYAWRRATVQRIIELDQVYPGLERHALIRNYRCGRRITEASRRLIQHNHLRFRKPLRAGARQKGDIIAVSTETRDSGAALVAHLISDADPKEVVVLARTSRLLAEIREAAKNLPGSGPEVELATIHAAKGREWNRVILFAVDEGQTPHTQAIAEKAIEDERRLFYVAMTRAKIRLEIVCTRGRESRFLKEAGLKVGNYEGTPPVQRQAGSIRLQQCGD